MRTIKWNIVDVVVLLAIFYSLVSYFFSDYMLSLYYFGVKTQVSMMFFYYIGRNNRIKNAFIQNFKWPMAFVIISGILLYFFPPAWYNAFRYSFVMHAEGTALFYEYTRMSSFFLHPYFLGYGSSFFIIYIVKNIIIDRNSGWFNYFLLTLALFALVFSQMRVAIAYTIVFLVLTFIYNLFSSKKNKSFNKFIITLVPLGIGLFVFISNIIDTDFLNYILDRTTNKEGNVVEERFNQFSSYYKYISFFGSGLGRFGHVAERLTHISIADNEYIRTLCELGIIGLSLILIPILSSIMIGFLNLRKCFFYSFVVLFYPFAMLGATPLEVPDQHVFLLWFCVGHIITITRKKTIATHKVAEFNHQYEITNKPNAYEK